MNNIVAYLRKPETYARYVFLWVGGVSAIAVAILTIYWSVRFLGWFAETQSGGIVIVAVVILGCIFGPPGWVYYDDHMHRSYSEGLDLDEGESGENTR